MQRAKQKGFTIVELLIVIVVIAILAAITIVAYNGIQTRARDASRDAAVRTLRNSLELYAADNNVYPNPCGTAGTGCNVAGLASALIPQYIGSIPGDPKPGTTIDIVSSPGFVGYGLFVKYESKPQCKVLVGSATNAGWWGAGVPVC